MIINRYNYNGHTITVRPSSDGLSGQVDVFDPREPPLFLYRTTSLDLAMKWVDARRYDPSIGSTR